MSDSYDDYESAIQLAEHAWEIKEARRQGASEVMRRSHSSKGKHMNREAMKHTPGPWNYDRSGYSLYVNSGRELVTALSMDGKRLETSEANARLIAAAPDLLDALLMVLDDPNALDGRPRTYEYVHAAIAKATGGNT